MIITVDCGTTNMRCRLFDNEKLLDETKKVAGCRNTAFTGSDNFLRDALRESVNELLDRNRLKECDVEAVVSSGTLASDVGIYHVPHVLAPLGVRESAEHAKMVTLPDITNIPILFIPGSKTLAADSETDMMRKVELGESMSGEECETYGIMKLLGLSGDFVITLPGSYNKAMEVDGDGRIISIRTGMCGEFIAAMSEHTLLRHSLPTPVIRKILPDKLICGYDYAGTHGVSPSMIKARMVRIHCGWDADEAANFFVGALLFDDIASTFELCTDKREIIVGGGDPLRSVFDILLSHLGAHTRPISDHIAKMAPSAGALDVYDHYKGL